MKINQSKFGYKSFKRIFDIVFGMLLLFLLFPFVIISAFLLAIDLKENPFFFQKRPGFNEKIFFLFKLKTMKSHSSVLYNIPDNKRVTKFSIFIRKLRIDEFLQLINIIKGDMSFVGPRPLLIEYLELYSDEQRLRHSVKPGVTGLAQINGSEKLDFKKRIKFDIKYVNNISFFLDVRIIFNTLIYIIKNFFTKSDQTKLPKFIKK